MNTRNFTRFIIRHRSPIAALCTALSLWSALAVLRPPRPEVVEVPVATGDLASGHVLTESDVAVKAVPVGLVPPSIRVKRDSVIGRALTGPIAAGEPLSPSRVLGPGLFGDLGPDRVAATVRVADAGAVGLLKAGDVVDILATRKSLDLDGTAPPDADVIADHARILAVPTQDEGGLMAASTNHKFDGSLLVVSVSAQDSRTLAAHQSADLSVVLLGG